MRSKKSTIYLPSSSSICLPSEIESLSRRELVLRGVSMSAYLSLASIFGSESLRAQESYPVQRKLIWINMRGGWDILEVGDPKPMGLTGTEALYDLGLAQPVNGSVDDTRIGRWLPNIAALGNDLLVVRGLAMGTTSHNAGSIYMDTGVLSNSGNVNAASIPAIVASQGTSTIPIIQLNGGADPKLDRGLLNPVSVVRANNLELYRGMFPTEDEQIQRRLSILDYVKSSVARLQDEIGTNDRLTGMAAAEDKVRKQFVDNVGLKLALTKEESAAFVEGAPSGMNASMAQSFALALKLVNENIVDTINLGIGGFDTHSNQSTSLEPLLTGVDFIIGSLVKGLKASGKLNSTLIVMYSDFGRTPKTNRSNGRDHWPVGSALVIGGGVDGGRAVGATDDNLRALSINPTTGSVVAESDDNAIQLSPANLGGSILELTLGSGYMQYRDSYLKSISALTRVRAGL